MDNLNSIDRHLATRIKDLECLGFMKTVYSTVPPREQLSPAQFASPSRLLTILSVKRQSSLWSFPFNTISSGKSNRAQKTIVHFKTIPKTAFLQRKLLKDG